MSVLFIALPVAILLGATAMVACVFCVKSGQYDDLDGPPVRILLDEKSDRPGMEVHVDDENTDKS